MEEQVYLQQTLEIIEGSSPSIFSDATKSTLTELVHFLSTSFTDNWQLSDDVPSPNSDILDPRILTGTSRDMLLVIRFPELTVRSEEGGEPHIIRDTYICMTVRCLMSNISILDIRLRRATATDIEISHGYKFSHANRGNSNSYFIDYSRLCFGSGEYSYLLALLSSERAGIIDMKSFLLGLERYLTWESISGGPYIFISVLRSVFITGEKLLNSSLTRFSQINRKTALNILNYVVSKYLFTITPDGYISVNIPEEYQQPIINILLKGGNFIPEALAIAVDNIEYSFTTSSVLPPDIVTYFFRNTQIKCQILNTENHDYSKPIISTKFQTYLSTILTKLYFETEYHGRRLDFLRYHRQNS